MGFVFNSFEQVCQISGQKGSAGPWLSSTCVSSHIFLAWVLSSTNSRQASKSLTFLFWQLGINPWHSAPWSATHLGDSGFSFWEGSASALHSFLPLSLPLIVNVSLPSSSLMLMALCVVALRRAFLADLRTGSAGLLRPLLLALMLLFVSRVTRVQARLRFYWLARQYEKITNGGVSRISNDMLPFQSASQKWSSEGF